MRERAPAPLPSYTWQLVTPSSSLPQSRCYRARTAANWCAKVFVDLAVLGGVTATAPPSGPLLSSSSRAVALRRVQLIARLRHPNLVRMLPLPGGAGWVPVVSGARQLSDFTLPQGTFKRFDLEQVVRLMLDVLGGLRALHEAPLGGPAFVHGQVCPQQVYVGEHGTARLVPLTPEHLHGVTPAAPNGYRAPELLLGDAADVRADLFSVGAMLWEALAGRRLFADASSDAVVAQLGRKLPRLGPPPRAAWARPLCAIAERAIAWQPAQRQASAAELKAAIVQAVGAHLARVAPESWQDEAPTPVFQPGLHLPPPRSTTPPPTATDLPASISSVPPVVEPELPTAPKESQPPASCRDDQDVGRPGRARAVSWAIGSAAALALVWGVHGQISSHRAAAMSAAPAPAAAAVAPAVSVLALPTASAAPSTSALAPTPAPIPSASSAPPKPAVAPAVRRLKPRSAKPAPAGADYGI